MEPNVEDMWNTHVHCFDPALYPFRSTRTYTPPPAPLKALVKQSRASRLVLVQASVEDGPAGLLGHLRRIRAEYPHLLARGIMCMDENWIKLTQEDFTTLHYFGVRYCRIHGFLGGGKTDTASLQEQIRLFAKSYPSKQMGWGLSAQLPLATWASLKDFFLHDPEVASLSIIADHVGCATPTDIGNASLDEFVQLLHAGRINVKISALYRRSGEDVSTMKPIIQRYADSAPSALLWGSDWPHVDASSRSSDSQVITKAIDPIKELALLQDWLTRDQFRKMLVENPGRLFGP
ncbi:hypothetical protein N7448_007817 [Penicillium atrosanguineum]|uniref:Amidohydrolase-related domain-containing protein n=1 Tax=Penicillium atrosanguineum TaxID=1132637 RepID=A0A9W9KYR8_9EURO|nr:uncharacterized protein N7443_001162 [Penicillium atrosanguineum]KAJ5127038.1 hypothetical protein N7448_007817 [Penicillium atrosanguineum]KAJ5147243.1 hypothetical protein N7526_000595 [Penicillium atrosanguineum]KAJ5314278.1 hypothetical protein N7443_001162 [Penicillium atrosanguineum]KAJ5331445.1 hypothetical protein N7476_001228 [Penicillium atrosanguineum]